MQKIYIKTVDGTGSLELPPDEYQAEILQIKTEIANGTFHYRGVKAYLK
ncbi:MAG: hypothetical protein SGJ00_06610 [bacterium]|nr:hypothetical protein [bacterium]